MVSNSVKKEFINFILGKSIITNDIAFSFFKTIANDSDMISNIIFSKYTLKNLKYHITINVTKRQIFCRMNGNIYNEFRLLRYIERMMRENKDINVGITIICSREAFVKTFESVCHSKDLVSDLLFSISTELVHNSYRKEQILKEIDIALDSKDKGLFLKLANEYSLLS